MTRRGRELARTTVSLSALAILAALPAQAAAQSRAGDFVVTGGVSWEVFDGNFSSVTMTVVDSSEHASAAVGEFGARGWVALLNRPASSLVLSFDGGLRQFAATGFELRDYAPREWVSRVGASYAHMVNGVGRLTLRGTYRGRAVEDRPPMPLFLQPGYSSVRGAGAFQLRPIQAVSFDVEGVLERADYQAADVLPVLNFLDRDSRSIEVGALAAGGGDWSVRFSTGLRWSHYANQDTQDPDDPFRRDRAVTLGALWAVDAAVIGALGVEGTVNRSNSRRPEYDALSVRGELFAPLPWWDLSTNVLALLTWKTYVHETTFARLVPGEEADNASLVYVDLIRPLADNLEATLRLGWTRAETDLGNSYYRRFGTSFLVNFRPASF